MRILNIWLGSTKSPELSLSHKYSSVGDYLVRVGGCEVKTGQDVRDAVRETSENKKIRCRFYRRHVKGKDIWIDIAKNREVWTDLVYEHGQVFSVGVEVLHELFFVQ